MLSYRLEADCADQHLGIEWDRQDLMSGHWSVSELRGHWEFGQKISDERRVDGCLTKSHVALRLAARGNEDELPASDALLAFQR